MRHLFQPALTHLKRFTSAAAIASILLAAASPAHASLRLIRDSEIEKTLRIYSDPIFKKAGLTPSSITMYIVNEEAINAFVMGGSNIFINTGLILQAEKPEMLIGVIAHETGHISGGHLVRTTSEVERAQMQALLGTLLGAAAMAGGAGDVGAAVISANQNLAMRSLYSFTRSNEQSADQAALTYLDELGISSKGMLDMFEILRKLEYRKGGSDIDPYMRTHPLSKERIMHIRNHVEQSPVPADAIPASFSELHQRMLGKLEGFLHDPQRVIDRYPSDQTSVRARYARAVAYHRMIDHAKAIAEVDALLATAPNDPYFNELKGQILFESGKIAEARAAYSKAVDLLPLDPLIRAELGKVLVASEKPEDLPAAIGALEFSTSADRRNPSAWRLLATAYGRSGMMGQSHLALAEEALLLNHPEQALAQLDIADNHISVGSTAALRAQDLRQEALERKKNKDKKDGLFIAPISSNHSPDNAVDHPLGRDRF